jgi:hypothetical protein
MESHRVTKRISAQQLAFECLMSTMDLLINRLETPPDEVLPILCELTAVTAFGIGEHASIEEAIEWVREGAARAQRLTGRLESHPDISAFN